MDYQVQLNNSQTLTLKDAQFDVEAFTSMLNDPKNTFVNIGGAIINKHTISSVLPVSAIQTETQA